MNIRKPRHASTFYPSDPDVIRATIAHNLNRARNSFGLPTAIIAPHAGWKYCMPVMATAFKAIAAARNIKRIIHVGPSHYVHVKGIVTDTCDAFETPLGKILNDRGAASGIAINSEAHSEEHALEVQLPFLQVLFVNTPIVPLIVGDAPAEETKDTLKSLGSGELDVLTVVSSDLSHYQSQADAKALDMATLADIEKLNGAEMTTDRACGAIALQGLLGLAEDKGWRAVTLDRRDSTATGAGDRESVVGYGAVGFYPKHYDTKNQKFDETKTENANV